MKKILAFFIVGMFIFPVENIFAAEGGYFHGKIINSNTGVPISWATDGDKFTGSNIRNSPVPVFEFDEPKTVTSIYYYGSGNVEFYSDLARTKKITNQIYTSANQDKWNPMKVENVMSILVNSGGSSNVMLYEMDFKVEEPRTYEPVTFLTAVSTHESVTLSWKNPIDEWVKDIQIYQDGIKLVTLNKTSENYIVEGLEELKQYRFEVFVNYQDENKSIGQSVVVKTKETPPPLEPAGEVIGVEADAMHNRIDLSWTLPQSDNFKHVIIYRDTLKKSLLDKLLGVTTVKAATPIFETNGTFFNDLTVQPETKYEYTLTTMSTDKVESDGVSIQVITPKEPIPEIEGGGHEKDPETGDYTYTWLKPTEGQVKVMVGGKLYKTVPAADGKIVIPAADMKFTLLGQPDVKLIPVSPDGNEGKPVSPPSGGGDGGGTGGIGSGSLPFKPGDLMTTTFQLIGLLSGIILIALVIQLVPRIVAVIKASIAKGRAVK